MSERSRKSRTKRVVLGVIALLILLPLVIVLSRFVSYRSSNAKAIRELEARIRDKREPLTLAELAATWLPIPAEENGAEVFLKLWEEDAPEYWAAFRRGESHLTNSPQASFDNALPFLGSDAKTIGRGDLLPANLAAAEACSKEHQAHLDSVRAALRYPRFRFPVQLTNGFEMQFPHPSELRKEANLLRIEALLAGERHDAIGAITNLEDVARTANTLKDEPIAVSQLARLACAAAVVEDMQRLLSRQSLPADELDRLDRLLDQLQLAGALRTGLVGERAIDLSIFAPDGYVPLFLSMEIEKSSSRFLGLGVKAYKATGLMDSDHRLMLETFDEAIALADLADSESVRQYDELFERAWSESRKFPFKVASGILLGSMRKIGNRFAEFEARRRSAKVAIAIERYQLSHENRLPERLEDLMPQLLPEIPADPFDGPLRYRQLTNGFVVYSIGSNRIDDGGKERAPGASRAASDETFIIER